MSLKLTQPMASMLSTLMFAKDPMDGPELARILYGTHRTAQGAHQTAAALVRHGLVERIGADRRLSLVGDPPLPVRYKITDAGRAAYQDLLVSR